MSGGCLTFLILTTAFLAVYSASFAVDRSEVVAVESVNGTPSVKVTGARAEVVDRSKVNEPSGNRTMEEGAQTDVKINTEKPSAVENRQEKRKNTTKANITKAQSGEDDDDDDEDEQGDDDYYDEPSGNATNIVTGPCAPGLRRDAHGTCRQDL